MTTFDTQKHISRSFECIKLNDPIEIYIVNGKTGLKRPQTKVRIFNEKGPDRKTKLTARKNKTLACQKQHKTRTYIVNGKENGNGQHCHKIIKSGSRFLMNENT